MSIKLIAFDLDDTLLRSDCTIGQRTVSALRKAHDLGIKIVPATGRGKHSMWNFVEEIGVVDSVICTNGAQIFDGQGNAMVENSIPLELAQAVVAFAEKNALYIQGYDREDYFFAKKTRETLRYAGLAGHVGKEVGCMSDYMTESPFKLIIIEEDLDKMRWIHQQAEPLFGEHLNLFESKPDYLEITSTKATKGNALRTICHHFGLMISETMCFGDSGNDLSMITCAGVGVVMGNAREQIQEHADLIAPTNQEEGVAQVIEKYILEAKQ